MFEEICIVCGKHLQDDGRAYCSDDCQNSDLASPSISSSSSALSSPQLGYAHGGDVPSLIPSVLGSALRKYQGRDPYYASSSASSSNLWSFVDDDDNGPYGRGGEYAIRDESIYEGSSKSASYVFSVMPSALSYTRRPSGTNNHSTVPQVHQRNSSGSPPAPCSRGNQNGAPRSAPVHLHPHPSSDEDDFSDFSLSSREVVDDAESDRSQPLAAKSKRSRNRVSLPECFSLLQMRSSGSKQSVKTSPVSSSSTKTIAPPTPNHTQPEALSNTSFLPRHSNIVPNTPRGRRMDSDRSRSGRRSECSSPSRSRSRHVRRPESPRPVPNALRERVDSKGSVEQVFDWDTIAPPRGRTSVRRNSSPPPRMLMGVEDPGRVLAAIRDAERYERSQSTSKSRARRGRVGVKELEGVGTLGLAPGYGNGRSGLVDRERFAALRIPL